MSLDLVEGWTAVLDFDLLNDGETPTTDMSGMTVALVLKDSAGDEVSPVGSVSVIDSTNWRVRLSLEADDLDADLSPYTARFQVTDGNGKKAYFPNGEPEVWTVRTT